MGLYEQEFIPEYQLTPPGQNQTFLVDQTAQVEITSWMSQDLNGSAFTLPPYGDRAYTNDIIQGISQALDNGDTGFFTGVDNVAKSMTAALRTSEAVPLIGIAQGTEPFIHVRWAWVAGPVTILVLAGAFVCCVMLSCKDQRGHVEVWKNNSGAVLFHGID